MPELSPMQLGYPRTQLRRKLVEAVLSREKSATSSVRAEYELDGARLPQVGDRFLLHDYDDHPVAVIETTEVRVLRVADVDSRSHATSERASTQSRSGGRPTTRSGAKESPRARRGWLGEAPLRIPVE
jgi:ASCH domain